MSDILIERTTHLITKDRDKTFLLKKKVVYIFLSINISIYIAILCVLVEFNLNN